ncbi:MAG: exo-alpha-sialidase [Ignavibacteria bacterium]|nr:exo-alpha-sialidase [Ignavibacteria bacterium]MBT8383192.1 exo-alpha-sialidase [Ignavibacteria bacterium]MBT8392533.1 exo-alpha-sialidase [Ignavibacteria bacterium]NNJ52474.1 T9SS type A sorting domain-containing protein [Ignavibacteriaceae bacterium]NNL21739.1 T9SS type A sorting domain-containing protein [Ignavibacteriaceae bacterium]
MKKNILVSITAVFLFIIGLNSFSFAQDYSSIFELPNELNTKYWLSRFPHSFTPIMVDYIPTDFLEFTNVNISNESAPQNEPSVRISRKDPNRVVAAWRDFRTGVNPPLRRIGYSYSSDGGETWSVSELTPQIIPNAPLSSDPVVVVDTSGNFYIVTVSLNETSGNGELWVFKSTDQGITFNQVYEMASGPWFEDKEWAATDLNPASPFANTLYCSWTRFAFGTDILFIRSTDEGVNWNSPVQVSDAGGVQGSFPAVGPNGEVYIVWLGSSGSGQILFDKSTDGGLTFGTDKVVSNSPNAWFPHLAVDVSGGINNGYIYAVWNDLRNGDDDVFISYSSDNGDTWSSSMRVNNDPVGNDKDQVWPSIAISEIGEIAILFYDTRNTPNNNIIEAYIARSTDGGVTFTNELLSTVPSPTNIPNSDIRFGDYINIDFHGGKAVPVWTDERAGGVDMDIYTAIVSQLIPVELTSFTAKIVDGKTLIEWTTATETNNLGFEVLRSRKNENEDWMTIGFVNGRGSSTEPQSYSFVDAGLSGKLFYRLRQVDYNGTYNYSDIIEVNGVTVSTVQLEQNFPNPFNPSTIINYQIGNDGFVNLNIYNSIGEEVAQLVNELQKGGSYQVIFDAKELPNGIYIYRLSSGNYVETKKMILLK